MGDGDLQQSLQLCRRKPQAVTGFLKSLARDDLQEALRVLEVLTKHQAVSFNGCCYVYYE